MSNDITCPMCGSADVMSSPDKARHFCANCKGEFGVKKPFSPLRIFLSYGHDSNEELVAQIKTDLDCRDSTFLLLLTNYLKPPLIGPSRHS
jgi:hypothetical protein